MGKVLSWLRGVETHPELRNASDDVRRASMTLRYPFTPKSNRFLRPGQFFAIPLSNGGYAAGRVTAVPAFGPNDRTGLAVGLMDWSGDHPPQAADLQGRKVLVQAKTNYRVISRTGGLVLGERPLGADRIKALDPYESTVGRSFNVWGWATICSEAERAFVGPDADSICWQPGDPEL
jgi:hypothetical protein